MSTFGDQIYTQRTAGRLYINFQPKIWYRHHNNLNSAKGDFDGCELLVNS